jgi:hypothetical protein
MTASSSKLKNAIQVELRAAQAAEELGELARAWRHLERAHILSQALAWPHVRVHLAMLVHAWRRRDRREVIGQIVRVLVAGPGSMLGRAPYGNTGGANVGIFTPMPVSEDLRAQLASLTADEAP